MASLNKIIERNKEVKDEVDGPVGVFVGGTSGIGEYTAYNFARYTNDPTIYIIGRSESAGQAVLKKLKEINPSGNAHYYFKQHDVTLIKDCDELCRALNANEKKVNLLFLSAGFLTTNGRTETAEGIDKKLAVNYYGRWRIVEQLMPLLTSSSEKGENTRVVSVLQPGNEGPVEEDDLDLKKNFTLFKANRHIVEFNSLMVARFAKEHTNMSFIHAHPGFVATAIARELPWAFRVGANALGRVLATSPETSAEKFFYLGWSAPEYKTGSHIVSAKLKEMQPDIEKKGFLAPELQEKVWNHTQEIFNNALNK
ncbi:hypothetical protein TRICI_001114 [Trichomonascus ciferrii]|uniref:Ketoreductase (KR) domain-containing protein n=1 Tax=Trichomonascus ciferrii TaxID=44093 RepID=A0A642VA84_9ASCO|nr:hypothetical protein TRICI_001114 [Trichomonascus ciferrii]